MNYQISGGNQGNTYDSMMFGGAGLSGTGKTDKDGANSILKNNDIGDLLKCKLVKGGEHPVLDMNGVQIKTMASKELSEAKEGDTIYLKIQQADKNKVSLKIAGIVSAAEALEGSSLGAVTSAQVMQSTEQFSDMIKENIGGALDEKEAKENQKEILRNISPEEITKLRMMQIDVTNSTLSDLIGMVINIRSNEHQDEVNELLSDIAEETIGKLKESFAPGAETNNMTAGTENAGSEDYVAEPAPIANVQVKSNLNSEGYVVSTPIRPAGEKAANGMGGGMQGDDSSGKNEGQVKVTEEQLIYLIKNNMDLTIENLNIARTSVNESSKSRELPIDNQVWNDIYPQVTDIIEAAGMTVSEQSLSGAQFMLKHELPITVDSLRLYMAVNSLNQRGMSEEQTKANINEQIAQGNPPEQARINGSTIHERATRMVEKVNTITMQSVDSAVNQGKIITISLLYNMTMRTAGNRRVSTPVNAGVEGASLSLSGNSGDGYKPEGTGMPLSTNSNAVAVRRQIEEIRLSMTMDAAVRLINMDINIDAKPLSQIVEALRKQENTYYEKVASTHDLHDVPEEKDLLKETLKKTDELKVMPAYVLGEMVRQPVITVSGLYDTASKMKASLLNNAYETMMTRPRSDMGDSITEAFQNIDDILKDLDLDCNEENQRAIRILAYNEMELSIQNIIGVKGADAKVQQMFETLTPQIVLNLIRQNKNPLNMTIDGLNEEIMQQKEVLGVTDEQRFSEFLYQMDKNNAITDEERQSFIGIYRLLDKVEKSHGKDIGALIRNGQEVTLRNLFVADKSRKARGINVAVDERFGERVDVNTQEQGILEQIDTAYNQTLTGSILRHIRPEILKSMQDADYQNMSFEELNALMKAGDTGAGETELSEELYTVLQEALSYEEEVSTMLEANDMPRTVTNIMAAHQVMYGSDGIFGMIHKAKNSLTKEKREEITAREAVFLDAVDSKEDVIYGLENIRSSLSQAIHEKESDGTITSMDIQALKYINAGMPIAMRAVEQDVFQVPIVVDDKVSIMKVSIIHDGSNAGEITATMDTPRYGTMEAFLHMEGTQVEGYVVTEDESGQRVLEANELTLRSVFAKAGMEVRDLRLDGTKPVHYGSEVKKEKIPTSKLYKAAKQLITAIKLTGINADN